MDNSQKNAIITYQGTQINLFSDERSDYVSLTDIFKAWNRYSKSINAWLKTKQTLEFLNVWEKKHNPKYDETQMSHVVNLARKRNGLSAQAWIEMTNAVGIFTRSGDYKGTYAHKDIAIRFAGWLNPEFELYLVEEIQRLREIEKQKHSYELLNHEQIIFLVKLKEVFKYITHQELVEVAHKDVFVSNNLNKSNPFAEFNNWRNKVLDISVQKINERIKEYCLKNEIALTKKILNKSKREKIFMLDSYESVKIAVWDFLVIKGEVNALNLASLVGDMIKAEKGIVLRTNETDLFHTKQDLGGFNEFEKKLSEFKPVKTAREIISINAKKTIPINELSDFNKSLKTALNYDKSDTKE